MSIGKRIKNKAAEIFKDFEEEDLFGVAIDNCDSGDVCNEENKDGAESEIGLGDHFDEDFDLIPGRQ